MVLEEIKNKEFKGINETIADFILKDPKVIINLSLADFAAACFVSEASVIRFTQKIGLKGFSDLKLTIAKELNSYNNIDQTIEVDIPIQKEDDLQDIAKILYKLDKQALNKTYESLDYEALREAARMIAYSDIVYIYGRGESLILAEDLHYKMLRIGKDTVLEGMNGFQAAKSFVPNSKLNRVAIIISHYLNSNQLRYVYDELMSANIPYILITANKDAFPYVKMAHVTLSIDCKESRFKMGGFEARSSFLYLIDVLYGMVFAYQYDQNKKNLIEFAKRKTTRDYFYHNKK